MVTKEQDSLLAEFLEIGARALGAVWYVEIHGCLDKIILEFDDVSLLFEAEVDFDTLRISHINSAKLQELSNKVAQTRGPWDAFIGKPFGWGWITINQQNYLDGVLLSFDGLEANILLNVMASSIVVSSIQSSRQLREHLQDIQ